MSTSTVNQDSASTADMSLSVAAIATTAAAADATTVQDQTLTFWLQNYRCRKHQQQHSDNDQDEDSATTSNFLLTETELPLPTIEQVLQTVDTFESLAQRDTEYLAPNSPELIARRDDVRQCKYGISSIPKSEYKDTRDKLFPLAKSGPMSRNVQNRAAYKLLESMDEAGITAQLFGPVEELRKKMHDLKQQERAKRAKTERGAGTFASAKENKKRNKKLVKFKPRDVVFVDVCGGPGGFSQAILDEVPKLPNTKVRGYGMTLNYKTDDGCDLRWYPRLLKKRSFTATYGIDGTGSVYNPDNVESLVSICSFEKKIQFVMGDGGFEVEDDKLAMQESITSRIVFSQWYMSLRLLSSGGSLVLKLFETTSVFLRSMLTLSCLFFERVGIVKPAHSRVVNGERYLCCSGFRQGTAGFTAAWLDFLQQVHCRAFEQEGKAPFTLLPNISLVIDDSISNNNVEDSLIKKSVLEALEMSIVTTATRQSIGLRMILDEHKKFVERRERGETDLSSASDAAVVVEAAQEDKEQLDDNENNDDE